MNLLQISAISIITLTLSATVNSEDDQSKEYEFHNSSGELITIPGILELKSEGHLCDIALKNCGQLPNFESKFKPAGNRLTSYLPNYLVWNNYVDDTDQPAAKVGLSIKYTIGVCDYDARTDNKPDLCFVSQGLEKLLRFDFFKNTTFEDSELSAEFAFVYNTEFDFYITNLNNTENAARISSPVVGRYQNPGLIYSLQANPGNGREGDYTVHLSALTFGLWHESNGQPLDNETWVNPPDSFDHQNYIDTFLGKGEIDEEYWKDTVSRSIMGFFDLSHSYYLRTSKTTEYCMGDPWCLKISLNHRFMYDLLESVEDTVLLNPDLNGGERADTSFSIIDYDRHRIGISDEFDTNFKIFPFVSVCAMEFSTLITSGDFEKDHISYDLGLRADLNINSGALVPLFFRWHLGPHENFAMYNETTNTFGVGIQFRQRNRASIPASCR